MIDDSTLCHLLSFHQENESKERQKRDVEVTTQGGAAKNKNDRGGEGEGLISVGQVKVVGYGIEKRERRARRVRVITVA